MEWLESFNRIRIASGLSLDEISAKSGVPKGTLSKITAGITKAPSLETMRNLAHAMGATLDAFCESEKPPPMEGDGKSELIAETVELFSRLKERDQRIMLMIAKYLLSDPE